MTEVLATLFAPVLVMLILVMIIERFIYACLITADFVVRLVRGPQPATRPVSRVGK